MLFYPKTKKSTILQLHLGLMDKNVPWIMMVILTSPGFLQNNLKFHQVQYFSFFPPLILEIVFICYTHGWITKWVYQVQAQGP